jgi:hypothetical protein
MLAMTDDDRGMAMSGGALGADPDGWSTQFGQTPATAPWAHSLVIRMWRQGLQPRDSQVRELWRLLRQQRRLGRRSAAQQFLSMAWRRGVTARDPRIRQFAQQLREWGLLPPRNAGVRPGYSAGGQSWQQQPPWWYTQPPAWYRSATPAGLPQPIPFAPGLPMAARAAQMAINPMARAAFGPGGLLPNVARLPGQALQTAAAAATAPARFISSLFR